MNKSLLWKTVFSTFYIFIKNLNCKIWNMLGERYFVFYIANLFVRQAHDTSVRLILPTPPILETLDTIILMKQMNLASLWVIEFSPAVIFKITSVLGYVENGIFGQLKLSLSAGKSFFYSKKALLVLPKFSRKHVVHPKYVQYCKYSHENTETISMPRYMWKYLVYIWKY